MLSYTTFKADYKNKIGRSLVPYVDTKNVFMQIEVPFVGQKTMIIKATVEKRPFL